jgi:ABC-2 type transport system permease protein
MSFGGLLRFLRRRFWLCLKAGYEYRASFWSQIVFMIANNLFLLWFWQIFFSYFSHIRGWNLRDTLLIYALSTTVFGLSSVFAGGAMDLAGLISDGELDYFIGLPPATLIHVLVTKVRVSAIGDLAFGVILLGLLHANDPAKFALALLICIPAALVFTSIVVTVSSLSFFLGESRGITFQFVNLMIAFSTYPETIFGYGGQGAPSSMSRYVLYILLPAAFMSHLPAHVLRGPFFSVPNLRALAELMGGCLVFVSLAVLVFRQGLKRYSSGSSMGIRI